MQPDRSDLESIPSWRILAGTLLFLHFYVNFVFAGLTLWDPHFDSTYYALWTVWRMTDVNAYLQLGGAVAAYMSGRGIIRDPCRDWLWIGLGLLACTLFVTAEYWAALNWNDAMMQFTGQDRSAFLLVQAIAAVAPLASIVLCSAFLSRRQECQGHSRLSGWAIIGTIYCGVASMSVFFFVHPLSVTLVTPDRVQALATSVQELIRLIPGSIMVATALALWMSRWYARIGAVVLLILGAATIWERWFQISWLIHIGIDAMYFGIPLRSRPDSPWIFEFDYVWLFVNSVSLMGPWLVLAYFAWRVPLREYRQEPNHPLCKECEYDLHGLNAGSCPECGATIKMNGASALVSSN